MKAQPEHLFSCLFWRRKTWVQSDTKKQQLGKLGLLTPLVGVKKNSDQWNSVILGRYNSIYNC